MRHINYCKECRQYTMHENCPACGKQVFSPRPPKYSPEDKYASYRRAVKMDELKKRGLI